MGQVVIQQTEGDPALELTVKQPAMVRKWNKDSRAKFNSACAKQFDFKEWNWNLCYLLKETFIVFCVWN